MANTNRNLVTQQRMTAEVFLKSHQDIGKLPKKVSGVICARFGKYVNIWQYRSNKLVGAISIDINNIDAFYKKLKTASGGFDYEAATAEMQKRTDEDDEVVDESN